MKNALLVIVILAMATPYLDHSARADTSSTDETPSLRSLLAANDKLIQHRTAKWILEEFDQAKYHPESALMKEFLSVLDDPLSGYSNGRRLAEIFSGTVENGTKGIGSIGPIQDISSKLDDVSTGLVPRIHALNLKLDLSGHMELQMPDTLFLYWKGHVFRLLNSAFAGVHTVDNRYVVVKVRREDPEGVSRLELWSLDTAGTTIRRILDLVIDKWVMHGGTYYELRVPSQASLGKSFERIEALYQEEIPMSRNICSDGGNYAVPQSPYFIRKTYIYVSYNTGYVNTSTETISGASFLLALSQNAKEASGFDDARWIRDQISGFVMFDADPITNIKKSFAGLTPLVQQEALLILQESTGVICSHKLPVEKCMEKLNPFVGRWKDHFERHGCNFPWKPTQGVVADDPVCHGLCGAQPAPSCPAAKRYVSRTKVLAKK